MWNEQDHPRDDDGKFTFKNGGASTNIKENPANILYQDSKIKAQKDRQESEYKSKLLNILGDKAKPTDILYGMTKELEEKIKEYGLQRKFKGGTITGPASSIENQETEQKVKLLPKLELGNSQTSLKGGISYDEVKTDNKNIDNTYFSSDSIKKAREFIQGEEDFRAEAYKDTGGIWTIGYGHIKNVKQGDKITKQEAERLYIKDFNEHIKPLKEVKVPLSDNEKIALASFIYNVGPNAFKTSTLLKKLNVGDKKGAAQEFKRWIYDNGKVQKGLVNRRNREMNLFLKGSN